MDFWQELVTALKGELGHVQTHTNAELDAQVAKLRDQLRETTAENEHLKADLARITQERDDLNEVARDLGGRILDAVPVLRDMRSKLTDITAAVAKLEKQSSD